MLGSLAMSSESAAAVIRSTISVSGRVRRYSIIGEEAAIARQAGASVSNSSRDMSISSERMGQPI